jgi:hypothetical protein
MMDILGGRRWSGRVSGRVVALGATVLASLICVLPSTFASGQGIAAKYVGDVGIGNDPDVILAEMFEDSVAAIASRWTQTDNTAGMSLATDRPAASGGTRSLLMTSEDGRNTGGYLYKNLGAGYDQVFLRYYVKYSSSGTYHHSSGWLGGFNPPTNWPQGGAGEKPTGSDRFSIGPEPTNAGRQFDLYTYWMDMRVSPDGVNYWGNTLVQDRNLRAKSDQWMCVEVMVKMNNPPSERNGELALWIDGNAIVHLREGSPLGNWVFNMFTPGPTGAPFEGFRWRATDLLKINWLWLKHYATDDPPGFVGRMWWDHVVLAKKYIGPINTSPADVSPPSPPTEPRIQ